ncbi:hypothetical protein C0989_005138, partial [Termitomyces sp. Mn162]
MSSLQNLAISLGAMQVARKIPFDDPQVLIYVRIAYVVAQVVVIGTYYFVSLKSRLLLPFPKNPANSSPPPSATMTSQKHPNS